jgi:hypothetical protein
MALVGFFTTAVTTLIPGALVYTWMDSGDRFDSRVAVIGRTCACGASQSRLRWFCRRSLEGNVPDPSTFSKNR